MFSTWEAIKVFVMKKGVACPNVQNADGGRIVTLD
jgi:hypothetical protein